MNTNYSTPQPAFTAKMVVNGMKFDPEKLNAVGKKLSEYTQHYKNDTLRISKELVKSEDTSFYTLDFGNNKTSAGFIVEIAQFKKWFDESSVDDIAKSFARVFKYAKLKEIKRNNMGDLRRLFKRALDNEELNRTKYELTKNPVFKTLAVNSERKAKNLDLEIKRSSAYYQSLNEKITDNPINKLFNWWEEF